MKISVELSLYPLLYIPLLTCLLFLFAIHLYYKTKIKSNLYISIMYGITTVLSLCLFIFLNSERIYFWDKPFHLASLIVLIVILTDIVFGERKKEITAHIPFLILVGVTGLSYFVIDVLSGIIFTFSFISYGIWQVIEMKRSSANDGEGIRIVFFFLIGVFCFTGQWFPFQSGRFLFSLFVLTFLIYECLRYFARIVNLFKSAGISSITDSLTGLFNEGFLYRKAEQIIQKQELSIIFIDIDNFKKLNDTKGHDVGDKVLIDIAKILQSVLNKNIGCRFGGEELVGLVTSGDAEYLAERFRAKVEKYTGVTVSVGVATGTSDSKAIIKLADKRMYVAKNSGKNRVITEGDY